MITLRQLEIFAVVVQRGSFRRCAEQLSISQVSVSEHMRTLETQLGVQLFERTPGGPIKPTEAGKRALEGVDELLSHIHDFMENVAGEGRSTGPLEVALHGFMMRNLGHSVQDWNGTADRAIHLRSNENPPEALQRLVMGRELDVAYFYSADGLDTLGEVVAQEPLAIFVASDHPLASQPLVTAQELSETPSISLSPEKPIRRAVDALMRQVGVTQNNHVVETAEFGLILSCLHRRLGYTCMFEAIGRDEIQTRGLTSVRFERPLPSLDIRRITRRAALRNAAIRNAMGMIESHLSAPV